MATQSVADMSVEDAIAHIPVEVYANAVDGDEIILRDKVGNQKIFIYQGGKLVLKTDNTTPPADDPNPTPELSTAMANVEKVGKNHYKIFIDNGSVLECDADGLFRFIQEKALKPEGVKDLDSIKTIRLKDHNFSSFMKEQKMITCPDCGATYTEEEAEENDWVCPACDHALSSY